jgi:hypothetical protein
MRCPGGSRPGTLLGVLTTADVAAFETDGFVKLAGAVPREVGDACRAELWRATGCDPDDPATWTKPVIRLDHFATPPFRAAANTPELHAAFDRLVGAGGWEPRGGLGTVPVRFPSDEDPGDAGWHIEGSFAGDDGRYRVTVRSRGRALLMLFLFSDVGPDDAPTRIRVGSHLDVPRFLEPAGDAGLEWFEACTLVVPASEGRPETTATGEVGDVYLCHPFLVHSAQPHRGTTPRFMAQPPLLPIRDLDLASDTPSAIAAPIVRALRGDHA